MPTPQDVTLILGDTWTLICSCHDATGNAMAVASAEWRLASTSGRLFLGTVSSNNIAIASGGVVTVTVSPSDQATANVQAGSFTHELFVIGTSSVGSIQITGKAHVLNSLKNQYP
jgi:hypothetical protein